ncbi:autotransporter domain-containing protein [Fusobacterium ulcerans]|uniref:autotransporter domain-containing protein n=1 Tax=Fusobacterium ulcerans TaxID=861 RepID=UPI0010329900|nr:autotransporter outer membrane beta-barrel domain-containing protein [Fusobacterium ulcerans]
MIEKIMKAVKRSSKRRSVNITIGAVVGFLLSCSTIIGADQYLWIKEDNGIKFSADNGVTSVSLDPYSNKNIWNESVKIYINNMGLTGIDNGSGIEGYGLKLSGNLEKFKFINNSSIIGTSTKGFGYGIYNNGIVTELINNGSIAGIFSKDVSLGISNDDIITTLTNNGSITGETTESFGSGIANNGTITELINNGSITGIAGIDRSYGISNDDIITTLTNNGSITGEATTGSFGSGIANSGTIGELTNNGLIKGKAGIRYGYGVSNDGTITELVNKGLIIGTAEKSSGYGISNTDIIEKLLNNGLIKGTAEESFGIGINNTGAITELTNTGLLVGTAEKSSGYGISNTGIIEKLINNGSLMGTAKEWYGYGISNTGIIEKLINNGLVIGTTIGSSSSGITTKNTENLINTGVVYGDENAVNNNGTIDSLKNYGILATKGSMTVSGTTGSKENYGLDIKNLNGIPIIAAGVDGEKNIIMGYADGNEIIRKMTIKNKSAIDGSDSFNGNESNAILNALKNTYKVSGIDNEIIGSIVNAYGTAIIFGGAGSQLTLSGTIVSGGIDGSDTVTGSSNDNTLILQSGTVDYTSGSITQNTIINGNINMGGGDDTVTVGNGTIINGILDGGTGNDTLNFDSPVARTSNSDGVKIQHNISGFENMNINTNVTLFEKTVGTTGNLENLTITGAENITIGANGVLTLRIDTSNINSSSGKDKIIGHALYKSTSSGTPSTLISSNGGKLLLALNGAGNSSIISFGETQLGNSLVTDYEGLSQEEVTFGTTSLFHSVKRVAGSNNEVEVTALNNLPLYSSTYGYENLNKIYHGIRSVNELGNFDVTTDENFSSFLGYLNNIYAGNPYSYSSELSRKSAGMFRDIVTENSFKADIGKWMIYGGLTHIDGGTKDIYYGKGYYTYDIGSTDMEADTKITGAYMLGEYGVSDTLTSGVVIGGNKLKSDLSNGSKVDGSALYLGAYAKKYIGNLKVTAGAGFQYGDYGVDRLAVNNAASSTGTPVMKYSDNYTDLTYDIYLNGRYSHNIGNNLFLEPYGTLSYTYIKQDGTDEGSKTLAIETDSKSFDYTIGKVGVDLKKVIPYEKGKSTLSAGVSYTKILDGADEEHITGRFKGGSDFDILVARKNEHSIGLNAKYALELENGVLFDIKGSYVVERDSHNGTGKNKTKGEWIVGTGLGYKF